MPGPLTDGHLEASEAGTDLADLEVQSVAVAASYGERKGITYSAWRQPQGTGPDAAACRYDEPCEGDAARPPSPAVKAG